jgi:hypothetical protein
MPALKDFLSRIQTDYSFYLQFQDNPQEALASYELTADQRAALTESDAQLSVLLGQSATPLHTTNNFLPLESTEPEFNPAVVLKRSEVRKTIEQILSSGAHSDRMRSILALMEEIGRTEHGKSAAHHRLA